MSDTFQPDTVYRYQLTVDTDQEAFDAIAEHLSQMTERAVNASGSCVYRTPKGEGCAVGAIIEDPKDSEALRYLSSIASAVRPFTGGTRSTHNTAAIDNNPVVAYLEVGHVNPELLTSLQQIHDLSPNWHLDVGLTHSARHEFLQVGLKHGLRIETAYRSLFI